MSQQSHVHQPLINYRLRQRVQGTFPASHTSSQAGDGQSFRDIAPLSQYPDPRRLDLRRYALDPFKQHWVRRPHQTSRLAVYVVLDLSASMAVSHNGISPRDTALNFCAILAMSVLKNGDSFGLLACTGTVERELGFQATRSQGIVEQGLKKLQQRQLYSRDTRGIQHIRPYLPTRRSLIFLISDFHLPEHLLNTSLSLLSGHEIIPIAIRHHNRFPNKPGFTQLYDPEQGKKRFVFMRPALQQRIDEKLHQQQQGLSQICRQQGCELLVLPENFSTTMINDYFYRHA